MALARRYGMLGDMRRDPQRSQLADDVVWIVVFVGSEGHAMPAWNRFSHGQRSVPFAGAHGLGHVGIDDQPMAVLHEHVPQVAQLGLLPLRLLVHAGLGIDGRGMDGGGAPLPTEIEARAARLIRRVRRREGLLGREAPLAGPGFDQRAIHREVLIRQQVTLPGLGQHVRKEGVRQLPPPRATAHGSY
jgi:hypothetical protein